MRANRTRFVFPIILAITLGLLLSACGSSLSSFSETKQSGTYAIDPLFKEYFEDLGGFELLGPAISTAFEEENLTCQYLSNALICHNPFEIGKNRYSLALLGTQFKISDQEGYVLNSSGENFINGYEVYPDFMPLYQELANMGAVGQPISQPRYNYEQERVEQFFEKVGFLYSFNDPKGTVKLLPYGAYACDHQCREYQYTPFAPGRDAPDTPFLIPLERLGGIQIFGQPLGESYIAPDGNREQIFENVVIYAPPDELNKIKLRPISRMLGMFSVEPGEKIYNREDNVTFYPVENELGYHVPIIFDEFIAQHGGTEISGSPIADTIHYQEDNTDRQCYTNYCLEYHHNAADDLKIRLTPLGIKYKEMLEQSQQAEDNTTEENSDQQEAAPEPVLTYTETQDQPPVNNDELETIEEPAAPSTQSSKAAPKPEAEAEKLPEKSARKNPFQKGANEENQVEAQSEPVSEAAPSITETIPTAAPVEIAPEAPQGSVVSGPIVLLICEQKPQISASRSQIIHLVVHKEENLEPVPGLVAKITLVTPNGEQVYFAPPTGSGGRASIALDPMPDVENGSLITYQVCVEPEAGNEVCAFDSYLIWNYQ